MTPLERSIEEIGSIGELIKALEAGHWSETEDSQAAGLIKDKMIGEKTWREKSAKKRPEKDKPYQNTLRVKKFLQ